MLILVCHKHLLHKEMLSFLLFSLKNAYSVMPWFNLFCFLKYWPKCQESPEALSTCIPSLVWQTLWPWPDSQVSPGGGLVIANFCWMWGLSHLPVRSLSFPQLSCSKYMLLLFLSSLLFAIPVWYFSKEVFLPWKMLFFFNLIFRESLRKQNIRIFWFGA